ncbi:sodium-dependent phosphate transport protein 3-like [Babylonia areolata]|uniref:sodium-dependent phosphate transport protein 3-like n=1 Tax=Babylonia areolata TaxID=304850 RepID=UPI003FCF7A5E
MVGKSLDPVFTFSPVNLPRSVSSPAIKQHDVMTRHCRCHCPKRWILAFSLCFMRMCQTSLRQNMGIALVCMTQTPDDVSETNRTQITAEDRLNRSSTEFHWSSQVEGQVLSAPYYGFLLTVPLAGYLDRVMGSRRLLTLSLVAGALLSLLTPVLARVDPYLLVVNRALVGAVSGVVKPAVFSLWVQWAPLTEQGILTAVDYAGSNLGGILTFFVSGFLCSIPFDNGWPFVFYVSGLLCLVCAIGVYLTVYDSPDLHPSVSLAEKELIRDKSHDADKGKIVRSLAVWAIVIAHFCHHWAHAALVNYLPMYINDMLHYPIAESGMLSAAAFAGSMAVGLVGGAAADRMQKHVRLVHVRKIFQLGGALGLSAPMLLLCWLDMGHNVVAVTLLVVSVSLFNLTSLAYRINSLDIAPAYASFITSMSSTVATALSMTAPMASAAILKSKSPEEWRSVLILIAVVSMAGGLFYVIFARADPQPWALETSYDVTVCASNVTPRHRTRSLPDDFREPPGTCVVLSVRRLQSIA